ncbi:hypothetical protein EV122DRAFT_280867 [Schizophyllum commune]
MLPAHRMADERYTGRRLASSRRLQSHDERAPRPRPSARPETHRDEDGVDDALYAAYTSTQSFDAVSHADATTTPLRHPMTPRIRRLHATDAWAAGGMRGHPTAINAKMQVWRCHRRLPACACVTHDVLRASTRFSGSLSGFLRPPSRRRHARGPWDDGCDRPVLEMPPAAIDALKAPADFYDRQVRFSGSLSHFLRPPNRRRPARGP